MDAARNDPSLTQEQKVTKINQIRDEASPKIKAILTPEQLQKLADMQQKARQQQPDHKSALPNDSQKPQQYNRIFSGMGWERDRCHSHFFLCSGLFSPA